MARPEPPRPTLLARLVAGVLGLALALALGELVAWLAHEGAWPTLNLYEPDERYGVALTPSASTRVTSPLGRLVDYRTNALGFRGAKWPPPAPAPVPGRVLIVGDSQVMGWGVPEESAFPARLAAMTGLEVLAAGVPTWGPNEYALAVAEYGQRYRPERVVFVVNAANDWDEVSVPNVRRTTARDGWARVPAANREVASSDGGLRRLLLGRSHLVLALRLLVDPPASVDLSAALANRFVDELGAHLRPAPPHRTRLGPHLARAHAACRALGCALVTVYLPMDIQVHPSEWEKYRVPPRDTRPALELANALAADVAGLSDALTLIDTTQALALASPGAYLPDDYHLSAAGHEVVAALLADRLASRPHPRETAR